MDDFFNSVYCCKDTKKIMGAFIKFDMNMVVSDNLIHGKNRGQHST